MNRDQVEGTLKEKGGELTGDEELEAEGEGQSAWGDVKDKAGDALDDLEQKIDR